VSGVPPRCPWQHHSMCILFKVNEVNYITFLKWGILCEVGK
jgi:hypothetical protein